MQRGVGLVFMPALLPLLRAAGEAVSVLEIEPQMLWKLSRAGGRQRYELNRERFEEILALPARKLVHSVGMPVGGTVGLDPAQAALVAAMAAEADAPWVSEHLSFNAFRAHDGVHCAGFLLPPRQVEASVAIAAANIRRLRTLVQRPVAIETGVNYLHPLRDEMPDGDFFAAVAEAADCGLLVDLHNLWANEHNGRQRAADVLARIPRERVWEVHVAGGMSVDGYWLDAHSGVVPEPVLELAAQWLPRWPRASAVVFEVLEEHVESVGLAAIERQLEALVQLRDACGPVVDAPSDEDGVIPASVSRIGLDAAARCEIDTYERALGRLVLGSDRRPAGARALRADPGVNVLRNLVADARKSFVAQGLRHTTTLLLMHLEADEIDLLFAEYLRTCPAELFVSAECDGFARFLKELGLDVPYLRETLDFEHALVRATLHGEDHDVAFDHDPVTLLEAIGRGAMPREIPETKAVLHLRIG